MRPALDYASSTESPLSSLTSINKLQVMQHENCHMMHTRHKHQLLLAISQAFCSRSFNVRRSHGLSSLINCYFNNFKGHILLYVRKIVQTGYNLGSLEPTLLMQITLSVRSHTNLSYFLCSTYSLSLVKTLQCALGFWVIYT